MTYQEAVSKRIYELCELYHITPNSLAENSSLPPSTLQNITSCKVKHISSLVLFQLCSHLNITMKDFFDSELFNQKNIIIKE